MHGLEVIVYDYDLDLNGLSGRVIGNCNATEGNYLVLVQDRKLSLRRNQMVVAARVSVRGFRPRSFVELVRGCAGRINGRTADGLYLVEFFDAARTVQQFPIEELELPCSVPIVLDGLEPGPELSGLCGDIETVQEDRYSVNMRGVNGAVLGIVKVKFGNVRI